MKSRPDDRNVPFGQLCHLRGVPGIGLQCPNADWVNGERAAPIFNPAKKAEDEKIM